MASPAILYLSHCVPFPPDKGEKIRAFYQIRELAQRFRVHLVCFARERGDAEAAGRLAPYCASIFAQPFHPAAALVKGALRFAAGGCLNTAYYSSGRIRTRVREVCAAEPVAAAVAYTAVMFPYVPAGMPCLLDLLDVDSEKWFSYAAERHPGFAYAAEARRLRRLEVRFAREASLTLFTTRPEERLFHSFSGPGIRTGVVENGVDFEYFDPEAATAAPGLGNPTLVFTGSMNYHPNVEAVRWFAGQVLPTLRAKHPALEFAVVGRNPAKAVLALQSQAGVRVTGGVPDVRPYLKAADWVVAPLHIARGIQNKVLEGLAMGTPALVSPEIGRTFGADLPQGVSICPTAADYAAAIERRANVDGCGIREAARARFTWTVNNAALVEAVDALAR